MKGNWKDIAELVGITAILVSLVFVGLELRATNVQSRANAFQSLGIATAEFHEAFDDRLNLLFDQFNDLKALDHWTYSDWLAAERMLRADVRLLETVLLQVDQGLLDASALDYLGFGYTEDWLTVSAVACLWPRVSQGFGRVGPLVRQRAEDGTSPDRRAQCPVDLSKLRNVNQD